MLRDGPSITGAALPKLITSHVRRLLSMKPHSRNLAKSQYLRNRLPREDLCAFIQTQGPFKTMLSLRGLFNQRMETWFLSRAKHLFQGFRARRKGDVEGPEVFFICGIIKIQSNHEQAPAIDNFGNS